MNEATLRLIQNSRAAFGRFSHEQLYQVALSLRDELLARGIDCRPEADALVAALLVHARTEHRAIYSADCAMEEHQWTHAGPPCSRCVPVVNPPAAES
jgi:hypothetical protein